MPNPLAREATLLVSDSYVVGFYPTLRRAPFFSVCNTTLQISECCALGMGEIHLLLRVVATSDKKFVLVGCYLPSVAHTLTAFSAWRFATRPSKFLARRCLPHIFQTLRVWARAEGPGNAWQPNFRVLRARDGRNPSNIH